MISQRSTIAAMLAFATVMTACGGSGSEGSEPSTPPAEAQTSESEAVAAAAGIRVASPAEAAATIDDAPEGLVILDVRTQEEFDEGHIDGAIMIDFYRDDFREQLAQLDPDVPYVLYCRSGNRSGQASAIMSDLEFTSVEDVNGGIVSWVDAGLPVVTP